jgi:LCP family protein required for cell wall assembly
MGPRPAPAAARKSAFAAAFFTLVFPGLGHAYLGRWSRALAWAILPILGIALVAGFALGPASRELIEGWLFDPLVLLAALGFVAVDLLYRLFAMLDAYGLARTPGARQPVRSVASAAGLLAVILVLVASHVAVARPVLIAHDSIVDITGGTEDDPGATLPPDLLRSFQPFTPPPTPSPDPSESVAPTPTPEPTPTKGPPWDEGGQLNILLIGADAGRPGYSAYLTDTMILVRVDTRTKQSAFISLPRDTQDLPIPRDWPAYAAFGGVYPYKANTIYSYAAQYYSHLFPGEKKNKGFNALKEMLGELYGLDIDYFVAVDLRSFREVINDLGGVIVDVQQPVYDFHYPADDGSGHIKLYIPPGIQYMQGQEALAYARARHVTSDFDRSARQQRVITSVRDQLDLSALLAPGVIRELLGTFRSSVKTDIPPSKIPKLISLAQEVDLDQRLSLVLDPPTYSQVCYPCPPSGLWVLKANVPQIRKAVGSVFKADRADVKRAEDIASEGMTVHVLNGTTGTNVKSTRIAEYLASMGVDAVVPPVAGGAADGSDYPDTVIRIAEGVDAEAPATLAFLERTFGVTAEVTTDPGLAEPTDGSGPAPTAGPASADIVVIVGRATPQLRP